MFRIPPSRERPGHPLSPETEVPELSISRECVRRLSVRLSLQEEPTGFSVSRLIYTASRREPAALSEISALRLQPFQRRYNVQNVTLVFFSLLMGATKSQC